MSDPSDGTDTRSGFGGAGSLGDYAACCSDTTPGTDWYQENATGVIIKAKGGDAVPTYTGTVGEWRSLTSFAKVRDGLGNTFLLGEKHVRAAFMGHEEPDCDGAYLNGDNMCTVARKVGPGYPIAPGPEYQHNVQNLVRTDPFAIQNNPTGTEDDSGALFGSWHPKGVVNFAMCDGSVRGFSPDVDLVTLGLLANRADEKLITEEY